MHRKIGTQEVRRRIVQQSVSSLQDLPQRVVLKPNLYHGRQDLSNFEAKTSVYHESKESEEYGETCSDSNSYRETNDFGETRSGNIDFRIQGLPHSTCQKQNDIRRETVKKLIHHFETHQNRESRKADLENNPKKTTRSARSRRK